MVTIEEYNECYEFVKNYIDRYCIVRKKGMPGKLQNTTYNWCFYLRNGLFNPNVMFAISQMFMYKINEEIGNYNFQIAGLETGSTPLLAGIPLVAKGTHKININAFSIRKEQKKYALKNWIEGIPNRQPVMIIDDLCNSSASMKKSYDILKNTFIDEKLLEVFNYAFCIVNKVNKGTHDQKREITDMYLPESIKIIYLFDLDDFNLNNPSH